MEFDFYQVIVCELQTFEDPVVRERLIAAWSADTGREWSFGYLRLSLQAPFISDLQLPSLKAQTQIGQLTSWLASIAGKQNLYILALTIYGLRAYDESEAPVYSAAVTASQEIIQRLETASAHSHNTAVIATFARNLPVAGGKRALELTRCASFSDSSPLRGSPRIFVRWWRWWRATQRHHRTKNLVVACGDARKLAHGAS